MTKLDAVVGRSVSRETIEKLKRYEALVGQESDRQNLVSKATLEQFWQRHVLDSAQLVRFQPNPMARWLDVGSGAGLPGIVVAVLAGGHVTLSEPRRLRADFLRHVADELGLRATIVQSKVEALTGEFDSITARAVASTDRLLSLTAHLAHSGTIWILPKGKSAKSELAEARRSWQCEARVEASCTDPDARILVLSKVRAKSKR